MKRPYRLSPLTTYQLRKLIRAREGQLSWKDPKNKNPVTLDGLFLQVNARNPDSSLSLDLLERLVTLHQFLAKTHEIDDPYLFDIESQIYENIGLQWLRLDQRDVENRESATNFYLKRCRDLLRQLNKMRESSEMLVGIEATLTHFLQSRPKDDWCQRFKMSESGKISYEGNINELMTQSRLKVYEQWMNTFRQQYESTHQNMSPSCVTQPRSPLTQQSAVALQKQWVNLQETANLKIKSSQDRPLRCRDLLKHLNQLQKDSAALMGTEVARICLLESCPQFDWCYMFNISETGSVLYSGNIREIVTTTRLNQYGVWIYRFMQQCETHVQYLNIGQPAELLMAMS